MRPRTSPASTLTLPTRASTRPDRSPGRRPAGGSTARSNRASRRPRNSWAPTARAARISRPEASSEHEKPQEPGRREGAPVHALVLTRCAGAVPSLPGATCPGNRPQVAAAVAGREHTGMHFVRACRGKVVLASALAMITTLLTGCNSLSGQAGRPAGDPPGSYVIPAGIHKIKHVIIVMQENRSFDTYFGTYPGAAGIPMRHGRPAACVPKPGGGCGRPYHLIADINKGGPHGVPDVTADVNGGKMDGFIRQRFVGQRGCKPPVTPACRIRGIPDVMGYHTAAEIPNYWAYAKEFALDDHMFEPVRSWSLAEHLDLVSAWSARCRNRSPMSCHNDIWPYKLPEFEQAVKEELATGTTTIDLAWTDITWLLHAHHIKIGRASCRER